MDGTRRHFTIFLFFLDILLRSDYAQAAQCVTCASPVLQQNWVATGFPMLKNGTLAFDSDCNLLSKSSEFVADCAGGICVEMLVVAAGQYAVVRGCHQTLMGGYKDNVATEKATEDCNFGNSYQEANASDCVACLRFDHEGDCHPDSRETCQGSWCTKSIGHLNGREVEMRGCSSINPLGGPSCVRVQMDNIIQPMSEQKLVQGTTVHPELLSQNDSRAPLCSEAARDSLVECLIDYGKTATKQGLYKNITQLVDVFQREKPPCTEFWKLFRCGRFKVDCFSTLMYPIPKAQRSNTTERDLLRTVMHFMLTFARCNEMNAELELKGCFSKYFPNSTSCNKDNAGYVGACREKYFNCRMEEVQKACGNESKLSWRAKYTLCELIVYRVGGECTVHERCNKTAMLMSHANISIALSQLNKLAKFHARQSGAEGDMASGNPDFSGILGFSEGQNWPCPAVSRASDSSFCSSSQANLGYTPRSGRGAKNAPALPDPI
ncbi:hypothetical protein DdX_09888 [Ditylenchus destructor]|uniref:Uncharacterized protein n=1 Tax=Ditylenchus destructor TaxID=166010 RepID=A0AAD4N1Y4_9BILA|nr:hypothetical protein DdX_09888 [Ditylenchus destructor]